MLLIEIHFNTYKFQTPEFAVQGLYENKEYVFRVAAANENGAGAWLEAENAIVAKLPFGENLNSIGHSCW